MTTSSLRSPGLDHVRTRAGRVALITGRIGAIFVAVLGIVHTGVNTYGLALAGWRPWVEYLTFGLGLSVIAFALAFGAWSVATASRPRWPVAVLVGIGGLLLILQTVAIAVSDPALLVRPLGPGLWSIVGGPALVLEVAVLGASWIGAVRRRPAR
ncbi:hypothetical protein [Microlunatus parietis]|uniref:Uncharacterized protein n=1 Tax=Microlunatus parietis TaxID=682979 RepID=A0A7Y9I7Z2_9ACTN|nr:hypothetical protein [Microlunatus parietis]NYE71725.1 hypothetical protein [Microlunatus parietis]